MTAPQSVIVPVNLPRLLAVFLVSGGGMVGGLLLLLGSGLVWTYLAAAVGGLLVLAFIVAAVRQRPRVVITPEGFTFYGPFGEQSRKWEEVHGAFAVINIGWTKAVAYNLTADYKARVGAKPTSLYSGYDAAIGGALALPAEQLADLLNAHARQNTGSAVGGVQGADGQAKPDAAADS